MALQKQRNWDLRAVCQMGDFSKTLPVPQLNLRSVRQEHLGAENSSAWRHIDQMPLSYVPIFRHKFSFLLLLRSMGLEG